MKKGIIKRHGHKEGFDARKVFVSIYSAALNSHYTEKKAESLANEVTKKINTYVKTKTNVTSKDIRNQIIKNIKDPGVRINYKHHLDLS